ITTIFGTFRRIFLGAAGLGAGRWPLGFSGSLGRTSTCDRCCCDRWYRNRGSAYRCTRRHRQASFQRMGDAWCGDSLCFSSRSELLRASAPFGGVAWVRLGWGQVDGPLAFLAAWGGPALVTVAAATVGTAIAAVLIDVRGGIDKQAFSGWGMRGVAIVCALVPFGLSFLAQLGVNQPEHTTDTIKVAAIQGNVPRLGLEFNAQRRAVLDNHVNVTQELADSGEDVDI